MWAQVEEDLETRRLYGIDFLVTLDDFIIARRLFRLRIAFILQT